MTEVVDKWVGFEIAPENGEKVEITLYPFFLFLFSLVLRFFLAFCSSCRERSGEILIVFVGFMVFSWSVYCRIGE